MNGKELVERVREARATELRRLGSDKALVALTDADLDAETVLSVVATGEHAAHETFSWWAGEADQPLRGAFEDAARIELDHYERVSARLPSGFAPESGVDPVAAYLRRLDDPTARAGGGLVGWPLVADRLLLQAVNFFVNEADESTADVVRDLRAEHDDLLERGVAALDEVCGDGGDWERARTAAEGTVEAVYDDYAETLAGMGLDPRPIC